MPSDICFHRFYVFIRHVDIEWRSGRDRVKKGQVLKSMFLHKKHMFLTKNFLKIANASFVFTYDVQNSQTLQVKILTSYLCDSKYTYVILILLFNHRHAFALYIAIKKDENRYPFLNVACAYSTCSPLICCTFFQIFTKFWIFNRFFLKKYC